MLILERDEKNYTIFRLSFGLESITRFEESLLLISFTVSEDYVVNLIDRK